VSSAPDDDPPADWRGEPLPRGRHKLSADEVLESQRRRLLRAMLECVGEDGYARVTVSAVIARGRVSRNAFYRFFEDKEHCFLTLCDALADELYEALSAPARGGEAGFDALLSDGMEVYLRWWVDRPNVARAWLVEMPGAGLRARAQRERQLERFEALFQALAAAARRERPDLPALDPLTPSFLAIGITEVVATEVRAGRGDALPGLRASLVTLATRLLAT
jgi:AcrR family transcriptional regulator